MTTDPSPIALPDGGKVIALSGGIGGAKLALGLKHILPARQPHRHRQHRR